FAYKTAGAGRQPPALFALAGPTRAKARDFKDWTPAFAGEKNIASARIITFLQPPARIGEPTPIRRAKAKGPDVSARPLRFT
ncbi:hypothetical protein ACCC88_10170, partial [Sphingomonas sp. Sphisp140]|uniref:hypothetical protein n=1 Tax=Sphingomonas sp. Sphisp140 TaxID=3243019 RepID=UPI0039AFCA39